MMSPRDLETSLESFLCASSAGRQAALRDLTLRLKEAVKARRFEEAAAVLRRAVLPDLDYTAAQSLHRVCRRIAGELAPPAQTTKLAVLSSFTSKQLVQLIELHLFAAGVSAQIYEADYGVFRQEILDPHAALYDFRPHLLWLATCWRDLAHSPDLGDDRDKVEDRVEAERADLESLWQTAHERLGCQIIQNNFEVPPWRWLGNYEMCHPASLGSYIARVNQTLAQTAPPFVQIHDVDHLSADAGRRAWGDERFFHHAKIPCAPEFLVDYAHSVASIIAAGLGRAKKCLVLDLDNTLWGGVIGDDGLGGIRLGQGDAESEAFLAFGRYVKGLQRRGVILAVCSKNEEHVAKEVFAEHPEMVLRLDDISCFVANWTDKATNLRTIARQLNIGLDALVFADDNPAERALVRRMLPEVAVPELPDDPTGYIQALERHRYFQVVSLGAEDYRRTEYYRANAQRGQARTTAAGVDDFLASLRMTARVEPIGPATLQRSVQLINRSNQFNLTTRRYTAAELADLLQDPRWISRTVALTDRFGDNGLIGVLLGQIDGDALQIDTWLMSCRVLKRGVEHFLLNDLCRLALQQGLGAIRGQYIPTNRNALVRDHYAHLGFRQTGGDAQGRTAWELPLSAGWTPLPCFIEEDKSQRRNAA